MVPFTTLSWTVSSSQPLVFQRARSLESSAEILSSTRSTCQPKREPAGSHLIRRTELCTHLLSRMEDQHSSVSLFRRPKSPERRTPWAARFALGSLYARATQVGGQP